MDFFFIGRRIMEVNDNVETLCSKLKGQRPSVEVIHHKSKKRISKINKNNLVKSNTLLNRKTDEKVNLRKLQNEIVKFTTHFDVRNTKAKEQLAIKLGAKPRKKDNINYKQLKEQIRCEAETKKNQEQIYKLPKTMVRTSKSNNKKPIVKKNNKQSIDIVKNYGTIKNKK